MSSNQPNPNLFGPPPPLLSLIEKPGRGRALITTGPVKPGQIIMVDTPLVVYPSSLGCLSNFCCRCFRVLPSEPFYCTSCHVACFCSEQCLSLSHPHLLCHTLPSLSCDEDTGLEDLLFLLSAYSLPSTKFFQLLSLYSDSSFPDEYIGILHSELVSLLPADIVPSHFSCENTSSLISMEKNKSFTLLSPSDPKNKLRRLPEARTYGVYLWASLLNHDCMPNVCGFHYIDDLSKENNTDIVFRALHEIKEGSEICTSYVGAAGEYRERQKKLMEVYGFKCECERCQIESERNQGEEEEDSEEETEEEIELYNEEEEIEVVGKGDLMSEGSDGSSLIGDYIENYICACGGFLAPMLPSQDGTVSNEKECNGCHGVFKDDTGNSEDEY